MFIRTFYGDSNGFALLNAKAHERHQLFRAGSFIAFADRDFALVFFALLDQDAGGASMDADGIGYGIVELLKINRSFLFKNGAGPGADNTGAGRPDSGDFMQKEMINIQTGGSSGAYPNHGQY